MIPNAITANPADPKQQKLCTNDTIKLPNAPNATTTKLYAIKIDFFVLEYLILIKLAGLFDPNHFQWYANI